MFLETQTLSQEFESLHIYTLIGEKGEQTPPYRHGLIVSVSKSTFGPQEDGLLKEKSDFLHFQESPDTLKQSNHNPQKV